MTERSRFWDGLATGDATEAPYDAPTEFAAVMMAMTQAAAITNKGGVWLDDTNDFSISSTGANNQRIATGRAQVYGSWYESDANVDVTIPTPAASTRVDRIVLRKSWSAQTVRVTRIAGTEGAGVPAMTQSAGTTWDVPLYSVSITTGGAMTVTDNREILNGLYGAGMRALPGGTAIAYGVSPSAWSTSYSAFQVGQGFSILAHPTNGTAQIFGNSYFDGTNYKGVVSASTAAIRIAIETGSFVVATAPAVTGGSNQTFTNQLSLTSAAFAVTPNSSFAGSLSVGSAAALGTTYSGGVYNINFNTAVFPTVNNGVACGVGGNGWSAVNSYSYVTLSRRDAKDHVKKASPSEALKAIMDTEFVEFRYKLPTVADLPNPVVTEEELALLIDYRNDTPERVNEKVSKRINDKKQEQRDGFIQMLAQNKKHYDRVRFGLYAEQSPLAQDGQEIEVLDTLMRTAASVQQIAKSLIAKGLLTAADLGL